MELNQHYQSILDESFRNHFSEWDSMSALDPTKVVAESVSCALAAVEGRQNRMVDSILDSLPALFSLTSKPGRLPVGLFSFKLSPRLTDVLTLDESDSFRFQLEQNTVYATPEKGVRLFPSSEFVCEEKENAVILKFRQRGPSGEMSFQFLPENGVLTQTSRLLGMSLVITSDSKRIEKLSLEELMFDDETQSFSRFGTVSIKRLSRAPLISEASSVELKLIFEELPTGSFHMNLVPCRLGLLVDSLELGPLNGEPWEEVALPETLLDCPSEIRIQYPDSRSVLLKRLQEDVLKLRHSDPKHFREGFLYQGVRHSVLIPAGDLLKERFNGGVTLSIPKAELCPGFEWVPEAYQAVLGEYASSFEEVIPFRPLLLSVPRERAVDYMGRFYAVLRAFHTEKAPLPGLFVRDLEREVLGADPWVRRVEVAADETNKFINVHCLAEQPMTSQAFSLEPITAKRLQNLLSKIVPLQYQWKLGPFYSSPLSLNLTLKLEVDEDWLGQMAGGNVEKAVSDTCKRLLLPPPFGLMAHEEAEDKSVFIQKLSQELVKNGNSTPKFSPEELIGIDLLIRDANGVFLESFRRKPGECFLPEITVKLITRIRKYSRSESTTFSRKESVYA